MEEIQTHRWTNKNGCLFSKMPVTREKLKDFVYRNQVVQVDVISVVIFIVCFGPKQSPKQQLLRFRNFLLKRSLSTKSFSVQSD